MFELNIITDLRCARSTDCSSTLDLPTRHGRIYHFPQVGSKFGFNILEPKDHYGGYNTTQDPVVLKRILINQKQYKRKFKILKHVLLDPYFIHKTIA